MARSAVLGAPGPGVFFVDRGGELTGDGRELAERASDRREADALQRLAEVLPCGIERGPQLGGPRRPLSGRSSGGGGRLAAGIGSQPRPSCAA